MRRPYQITSIVFMLFSAYVAWLSLRLSLHTPIGTGPGFFPFWIATAMGALAAAMFFQATFRETDPMPAGFFASRTGYLRMAGITAAMIAVVMLMDVVGFRLVMLLFMLFLLVILGRHNLVVTALVALACSFGAYHVFVEWLKVPLPIGVFGI